MQCFVTDELCKLTFYFRPALHYMGHSNALWRKPVFGISRLFIAQCQCPVAKGGRRNRMNVPAAERSL